MIQLDLIQFYSTEQVLNISAPIFVVEFSGKNVQWSKSGQMMLAAEMLSLKKVIMFGNVEDMRTGQAIINSVQSTK